MPVNDCKYRAPKWKGRVTRHTFPYGGCKFGWERDQIGIAIECGCALNEGWAWHTSPVPLSHIMLKPHEKPYMHPIMYNTEDTLGSLANQSALGITMPYTMTYSVGHPLS